MEENKQIIEEIETIFGDKDSRDFIEETIRTKVKHIFLNALTTKDLAWQKKIEGMKRVIGTDFGVGEESGKSYKDNESDYNKALSDVLALLPPITK